MPSTDSPLKMALDLIENSQIQECFVSETDLLEK